MVIRKTYRDAMNKLLETYREVRRLNDLYLEGQENPPLPIDRGRVGLSDDLENITQATLYKAMEAEMALLRISSKHTLFDLEFTKKEREYLKRRLEGNDKDKK